MTEIYTVLYNKSSFIFDSYVFDGIFKGQSFTYVISPIRNDYDNLIVHLSSITKQVGYNNLDYDYKIIHYLIEMRDAFNGSTGNIILQYINNYLSLIEEDNRKFNKVYIKQLDVGRTLGLITNSKSIPIEAIGITCKTNDINPISNSIEYNINICHNRLDTIRVLYFTANGFIKLNNNENVVRAKEQLQIDYNSDFVNSSHVMTGYKLVANEYARLNNLDRSTIYGISKSPVEKLKLKDALPFYSSKVTYEQFIDVINELSSLYVTNSIPYSKKVPINNIYIKFGSGGLHGNTKQGIYSSDNDYCIVNQDIISCFTSIACRLNIYPRHLNSSFVDIIKELLSKRIKEMNRSNCSSGYLEVIKRALNGIYGKTKEENSFLYDNQYSIKIIFSAQVLMCAWLSLLISKIPDIEFMFVNTDGLCYRIKKCDIDKVKEINNIINTILSNNVVKTKIYDSIVIKDCNNYMLISNSSDTECKGIFYPYFNLYKDNCSICISKAIYNYFQYGIPVEETINDCKIHDFVFRVISEDTTFVYFNNGVKSELNLPYVNRYFYSTDRKQSGSIFYKKNKITDNTPITIANTINDDLINIVDKNYYISKAVNIIDELEEKQLSLF